MHVIANYQYVCICRPNYSHNFAELYPVPLTPEFIVRCSFIKTDQYVFEHPEERIELEYDHKGVTHMRIDRSETALQLTALHELQHAYWVITNKELSFK